MQLKILEFILAQLPGIQTFVSDKIQELEDTMVGAKGLEKKEQLDKQVIEYVSGLLIGWDIPQIPNIIENNIVDPLVIKTFELFIPQITQSIYDLGLKGINKAQSFID